jgi:hypothetical protein
VSGYRRIPLVPNAQFQVGAPGNQLYYNNGDILITYAFNPPGGLWIPMSNLPHGHTLVGAKADFVPGAAVRGGNPPGNLPAISLYKTNDVGAPTSLGSTAHVWSDEATYEAGFVLTIAGLTEVINMNNTSYAVSFSLEGGANSFDGLQIRSLHVYCTIDHAYGGTDLSQWI